MQMDRTSKLEDRLSRMDIDLCIHCRNKFERTSLMNGHAIAIAELADIRKYNDETDRADAFLDDDETFEGYSWIFNRVIPIVPFPVKGKLHLFEVDHELDDLEAIDIDYDTKQYDVDVATWWKENGFIENLNIFGEE